MSTSNSYRARFTRRATARRRLQVLLATMPGITDVNEGLNDRVMTTDRLSDTLTQNGFIVDVAQDVRGSAIWAEAHNGLVMAAVLFDDGRVDIEVAGVQGPVCTHEVDQLRDQLVRSEGIELDLEHEDRHDCPGGSRLAPLVRPYLLAHGDTPAAALLEEVSRRPHWVEAEQAQSSERRQIEGTC